MGHDRSWVVRITTAECAVELRCSAGGFCSVALQCGFAVGCEDSEDTGFCPLRIMWCAPEHFCENRAFIYTYSKQKVLSFGNDLTTESNANVLSEI